MQSFKCVLQFWSILSHFDSNFYILKIYSFCWTTPMQHHIDDFLNQCEVYLEFFHFKNLKLRVPQTNCTKRRLLTNHLFFWKARLCLRIYKEIVQTIPNSNALALSWALLAKGFIESLVWGTQCRDRLDSDEWKGRVSGDFALLVNQTGVVGGRGTVSDPSTQLAHFLSSKRHKLDDILTLQGRFSGAVGQAGSRLQIAVLGSAFPSAAAASGRARQLTISTLSLWRHKRLSGSL